MWRRPGREDRGRQSGSACSDHHEIGHITHNTRDARPGYKTANPLRRHHRRRDHVLHDGLHRGGQSLDPRDARDRYALHGRDDGHRADRVQHDAAHGPLRATALRRRARHGPERVLRLHHRASAAGALADRARDGVLGRRVVSAGLGHAAARGTSRWRSRRACGWPRRRASAFCSRSSGSATPGSSRPTRQRCCVWARSITAPSFLLLGVLVAVMLSAPQQPAGLPGIDSARSLPAPGRSDTRCRQSASSARPTSRRLS